MSNLAQGVFEITERGIFRYFQLRLITHLTILEQRQTFGRVNRYVETVEKSFSAGTVRDWEDGPYVKMADGTWKKVPKTHAKTPKVDIGKIKDDLNNCKTCEELRGIIVAHKAEFSTKKGVPLPIAYALKRHINGGGNQLYKDTKAEYLTYEGYTNLELATMYLDKATTIGKMTRNESDRTYWMRCRFYSVSPDALTGELLMYNTSIDRDIMIEYSSALFDYYKENPDAVRDLIAGTLKKNE